MKTSVILVLGLICLAAAKPHNEGKRNHPPKRSREHKLTNRMEHDHHRREHGPPHKIEVHHGRKAAARRPATPDSAAAAAAQGQHEIKKDLHLQHITEHNIEKKHEDKWVGEATSAGKHHLLTNRVPSGENTHLLTNRTPQVSSSSSSSSSSSVSSSPAPSDSSSSSSSPTSSSPGSPNNSDNKNNNNTKNKGDGIPMESERLIHVTPRPPKVHKVNNNNNNNKPQHRPLPTAAQDSPLAQTNKGKGHKSPKKFSPKKHGWKKNLRKEKSKDKVKEKRERREKRNKALHRAMAARQL
ncbi:zinc finger CCHC domain-containing protein 10-like isoform X2 [Eriocheir sinensis]|uniref:zinc finger CCHC domain-containing protein 10-like isoform X2 n=1 Tax=Eriocheir sinensis TaxID=95602 RepID=UPI0021C807B0|nr:zinc finger CCHC domain-containing protein 10-like isoform X2 [Eriocheir sinensis]